MNRRRVLAALSAVPFTAGLPQIAGAAGPLRILTTPSDPGAEPYYAQELGFFHAAGIDPEIIAMGSGAVVLSAVVANSAEIGFANLTSLVLAFKKNIPLTIIAPGTFYDTKKPTPLILVSKTSSIRSAADLNGKTIAAAGLGTVVEWAARIWMDKNGGDSTTAKFVEMNMPLMADAVASGRIDASVVSEPYLAQARPQSRVLGSPYDSIAPHFTIAAYFANLAWARANTDTVARFRTAIARTAIWTNNHPVESAKILQAHTKIDPDIAQKMVRVGFEDRLDAKGMQPLIDLVAHYGRIDGTFPADQLIFKP